MDPLRDIQLGGGEQYGPLPGNFRYTVREGYTALVGPNNAGKSSLLQLIFRSLFHDAEFSGASTCYIPSDREYIDSTTETGGRTLATWNGELLAALRDAPLPMTGGTGPPRGELTRLLLHGNFLPQMNRLNGLLPRFGLPEVTLSGPQHVQFEAVVANAQGSGLRSLLPVLAAVTNDDISAVLVDEPELSLEPRLQKSLRDLLVETAETKRIVAVSTHSHLLINRQLHESTQIVTRTSRETSVATVATPKELYALTFDLLGSSTEDLFFPKNYLIVEGLSDQVIVQRVLDLIGASASNVKVLSAQGVDEVRQREISVIRALVPLVVNDSPYAGRVVALIDAPADPDAMNVQRLRDDLGDRLHVLDAPSVEAYIPAAFYERAGRSKENDIEALSAVQGNLVARGELKRAISHAITGVLTEADLDEIPIIRDAVYRAADA